MKTFVRCSLLLSLLALLTLTASAQTSETQRWPQRARNVTIHARQLGHCACAWKNRCRRLSSELIYAQAEDDFNRVETNFINSQGPLSGSGRRIGDLARLADEAVYRSSENES
jgi:acyl-homoserine-lactone acylase